MFISTVHVSCFQFPYIDVMPASIYLFAPYRIHRQSPFQCKIFLLRIPTDTYSPPPRANELALSTNKKTITPQNVLEALSQCEYEDFLPRVKAELDRFNEIATGKRNEYRRKIKEKETGGANANGSGEKRNSTVNGDLGNGGTDDRVGNDDDEGEERARKRVRMEEGTTEGMEGKENGTGLQRAVKAAGTPDDEDEERYDTAMEDEGAEGGEGDAPPEDDTELEDDEVEEDERDVSQVMDGRPDGLSSGVDDDDDESDDEEESD